MKDKHIIPVFVKDNEPVIAHHQFIDGMSEVINHCYHGVEEPNIRVSHPIKGRIPEARHKAAKDLLENEKTLYYERMAFKFEVPQIQENLNGQLVSLSIGGVKAFNKDNLNTTSGSYQHFKAFVGFKVQVCTNLCIWTDGLKTDIKVRSLQQLQQELYALVSQFDANRQLSRMKLLSDYSISEQQFAQFIGRARMYHCNKIKGIPPLKLGDSQMANVVKGYYNNEHFGRYEDGSIDLWRLYNLMTEAVKSSYIDSFLEKNVNAAHVVDSITSHLFDGGDYWFLN